jgi:hypothetical protein
VTFLKESPKYSKTYNKFKEDENLDKIKFKTISNEDINLKEEKDKTIDICKTKK